MTTTQLDHLNTACGPWWSQAACQGYDPEWWADDTDHRPEAVAICIRCPVRQACLADAERRGDVGVVRGGVLLFVVRGTRKNVGLICAGCNNRPAGVCGRVARGHCVRCQRKTRASTD